MTANTIITTILDGVGSPAYLSGIVNLEDAARINRVVLFDAVPTFSANVLGFAPVATPTDILVIQGSATKTIRLKRISLFGVATAQGNMPAQVVRRATPGTLGSAVLTARAGQPRDILNDGNATAVVSTVGTANYTTLGTLVGVNEVGRISFVASGSGNGGDGNKLTFDFMHTQNKPLILNGTSDFICLNLNGAALPAGGLLDINVLWSETSSV